MSILIKGMEMPKDDEILCINIRANGDVYYNLDLSVKTIANAVHVPPHGRLIDADELLTSKGVGTQIAGWGKMYHETCIEYAPTVIPADKEE